MATKDDYATPHFLTDETIVISGAGISGLAFAISLHKLWPTASADSPPPPLTLYERDSSAVPEGREGYSLSLRSDPPSKGIQTLQKMGLLDRMLEASIMAMGGDSKGGDEDRSEGGFCVWDKDFNTVLKMQSKRFEGCPIAGMRIARANLRLTLVDAAEALPGVTIKWDEAVTTVESASSPNAKHPIQLTTSKGAAVNCSMLIAADGSSSKLRSIIRPHDILHFAGPTCVYGVADIKAHHPSGRADEFGSAVSGAGPACFVAPVDHEKMLWCLSWHVDEPPAPKKRPLSEEDADALLGEARRVGLPFGPRFREMLDDTDVESLTQFNALDKQPFAHTGRYIAVPGLGALSGKVVFLGDANHAVSPFAGNGANLALMDGWDFAESLVQANTSLEDATRRYDLRAVGRAKQVLRISHFSIRIMHSRGWVLWMWMGLLRVVRWLFFKSVD